MQARDVLKLARTQLGHKQKDAARLIGTTQKEISLIEKGQRTNIPIKYIEYLSESGLDLNKLFRSDDYVGNINQLEISEDRKIAFFKELYKEQTEEVVKLRAKLDKIMREGPPPNNAEVG